MKQIRNSTNFQKCLLFPGWRHFVWTLWIALIINATSAVKDDQSETLIQIKKDSSLLDDQLPDVILTAGQKLDEVCENQEQPFPRQLDCAGLGIKFLEKVKLSQDAKPIYETLILAGNRIEKLNNDTFDLKSVENLLRLDISSNRLAVIESNAFKSFESLVSLNLANNQFRTLPIDAFNAQLPRLLELNLADNQLWIGGFGGSKPGLAFPLFPTVRRLDLSGNTQLFQQTPDEFLSSLRFPSLKQLRMANCGLRNLTENLFGKDSITQSRVQRLDLSGNRFDRIPNQALHTLPHLHELVMNDNPNIYNLNRDQLSGLRQLRSLQVSRLARLRSIGAFAFQDLANLRELICSQNPRLIRIEANAFHLDKKEIDASAESPSNLKPTISSNNRLYPSSAAFPSKDKLLRSATLPPLRVLHLQQNALATIHPFMINYRQLRSFDLSANPLRCDCQLNFLLELPQTGAVVRNSAQTTCARPRRWVKLNIFQAATVAMGGEANTAETSGLFKNGKRLEFECQQIFDEDNDVFWGMFLLLFSCFVCVVLIFCALSLHVRTRFVNLTHACFAFVGFRRSWMNCYDCCGLFSMKGKYSSFDRQQREQRRQDQQEPVDRIRADLEWDDNELDL